MKNKKIIIVISVVLAILITGVAIFAVSLNKKNSSFEVSFLTNGGTITKTQNVSKGEKVKKPDDPKRDGYEFIEWTYNGQTYDFSSDVTADIKLEAKWLKINEEKETFVIKFDSDGGTTISNQIVEKGAKIDIPLAPKKEGYVFKFWTLNSSEYNFDNVVEDNLELKAKWEKIVTNSTTNNVDNSTDKEDTDINTETNNGNVNEGANDNSDNDIINNTKPAAPTLYSHSGGMTNGIKIAKLSIISMTDEIEEVKKIISGYELYEKTGNEYTLIHTSESAFAYDVSVDIGERKTYVARVYKYNKSNKKIYSDYSKEFVVDNLKLSAPTLYSHSGGITNGIKTAKLSIISMTDEIEEVKKIISGYELYEKTGNEYTLIHTSESAFAYDVSVDIGERKTYVARVYKYNKSNKKIYSDYSKEFVVDNSQ